MFWFLLTGFLLVLLVGIFIWLWKKVTEARPESYPSIQNRQKLDTSRRLLVCLGDSNTHGNVSYDWVSDLARFFVDIQVFNAGINSDLTYSLLNRLDDVIACQPAFVTILIGTNDVNATMSEQQQNSYKQMGRIPKDVVPDLAAFERNYQQIVGRLKQETNAKIALISLPVMSEDLAHEANKKADKYSEYIKKLANEQQLSYLPLREKQKEFLQENKKALKHTFEESYKLFVFSIINHFILDKDWDYTSKKHGFQLTPDNLHQNSIAGGMIRELVKEFVLET